MAGSASVPVRSAAAVWALQPEESARATASGSAAESVQAVTWESGGKSAGWRSLVSAWPTSWEAWGSATPGQYVSELASVNRWWGAAYRSTCCRSCPASVSASARRLMVRWSASGSAVTAAGSLQRPERAYLPKRSPDRFVHPGLSTCPGAEARRPVRPGHSPRQAPNVCRQTGTGCRGRRPPARQRWRKRRCRSLQRRTRLRPARRSPLPL